MELKEGYKQTEVGSIPNEWSLVPFDKIFDFNSTSNYSKTQMSTEGEIGCIHYGLIHAIPNTQYDLKNGIKYYVTKEQAKYELVRDGDVIMVDASEDLEGINKSVEVCGVGCNKFISGLHTYLLRDKNNSLANKFRGIVLNSRTVKNQMLQLAVGMKVFGVSKTQLVNVKIPLPPLHEQTAIATVLSDTDQLIQAIEKKIAKKRLIKQGAMQELLRPKEGWVERKLGEICDVIGGGTPSSFNPEYWNGNIDWFTPTEIGKTKYVSSSKRKITKKGYDNSSAQMLPPGAILLTSRAGIGDLGILTKEASTNQGFQSLIPKASISNEFIYYLISNSKNKLLRNASGSTFLEISPGKLKSIEFIIPETENEQLQIAKILSDLDLETETLENQLAKYKELKQGLMQNLLTGKIRLV